MSTADLPLHDLVEAALEDLVATAEPDAGRGLIGELEHRGAKAMWAAALQLLRPLAARPAYGLPEREGAARLRAWTGQSTRLTDGAGRTVLRAAVP
jgi:hypothetical protein